MLSLQVDASPQAVARAAWEALTEEEREAIGISITLTAAVLRHFFLDVVPLCITFYRFLWRESMSAERVEELMGLAFREALLMNRWLPCCVLADAFQELCMRPCASASFACVAQEPAPCCLSSLSGSHAMDR